MELVQFTETSWEGGGEREMSWDVLFLVIDKYLYFINFIIDFTLIIQAVDTSIKHIYYTSI